MSERKIIVIGHRNPDLDSVASAISYSYLKNAITQSNIFKAAVAGEPNRETSWVLNELHIPFPEIVTDLRTRVEDLLEGEPVPTVNKDTTIDELTALFKATKAKTLPVVDEKGVLLGLITIGDIAMLFMNHLIDVDDSSVTSKIKDLLALKAKEIMITDGLLIFDDHELVDDVKPQMISTRYRNYPVVDDDGRFLGFISRHHLLEMKRKQVILVDHNEIKQAVQGVEEADIIEIIDHHRLGDIQTVSPIFFRNEPVGATSTLIFESYRNAGIDLEPGMAGLLLSGILSDTMIFRSPTTTRRDREAALELERLSGLKPEEWGRGIFKQAAGLAEREPYDIIRDDLKEYLAGTTVLAVAQVETVELNALSGRKKKLLKEMEELCQRRGYGAMFLMVTDIFKEGTEMLVAGPKKNLAEKAFGMPLENGSLFLSGVMSRKKQVVPKLFRAASEEGLL